MQTNRKLILVFIVLVAFMVSGSVASSNAATIQKLPTCTDPTGQNLPCMMIISTLPPPPNALQCQETSGQILPCSYTTQSLSNGEQIVAITVYVPASYVFTGYGPWILAKQVVHETKTRIVHVPQKPRCERPDADAKTDLDKNLTTVDCDINDANEHGKIPGCERPDADAVTDLDKNLKTMDCDIHDANEHGMTPTPPPSTCKDNTTCPYVNTTKSLASGKSGAGSTCAAGNCTSGTAPPLDCTKNPTDPSCTQSLTPSTSTPPTTKRCPDGSVIDASANCPTQSTPPSTPNTPSTPPGNNPSPPSSSDNGGGGSGSGNGGSGSGNGGSGSGSGGGSGPSQPTTVS